MGSSFVARSRRTRAVVEVSRAERLDPAVARRDRGDRDVVDQPEVDCRLVARHVEVVDRVGRAPSGGRRPCGCRPSRGRPRRSLRALPEDERRPAAGSRAPGPKAMKRFVNDTQFPRRTANASAAVKVATVSYSKAYAFRSRSAAWSRFRRSRSSPGPGDPLRDGLDLRRHVHRHRDVARVDAPRRDDLPPALGRETEQRPGRPGPAAGSGDRDREQ